MSQDEREQGREWVERELRRVARVRRVQLTKPIEWELDFDHGAYWVRIIAGGQEKVWKFSFEQLEDCVHDKRVRRELENAIAFMVPDGPGSEGASEGGQVSALKKRQSGAKKIQLDTAARAAGRLLRVFLCHSGVDKSRVRELFQRLVADSIDPWFDEEDLLPGENWERAIRRAVRASDVVLVCLSQTSVTRPGFAQKEIKFALDVADEQPEGTIYLIPVRLEECDIPDRLKQWHWVNLFKSKGYPKLLSALHLRATSLGISFPFVPDQGENQKNAAIAKFASSGSFRQAKLNFAEVNRLNQLSREQVERILLAAITNDQIYQPLELRRLLNQLFARHGYLSSPEVRDRFLRFFRD